VTYDGQENNFGRLLRFRNTIGRWREWSMPMELLRGSGEDMRGELLAMGLEIDPLSKTLLMQYLQERPPKRRVRCALQVGWCGGNFVLPDVVIEASSASVIFQSGERGHDEHTTSGTLEGWMQEIAARAIGNPVLTLALSAAFAGPMLARCNAEGGGIHFVGDSSTGKTTAIEAACSVWGGPTFRRSWRATANGMEGAAALFNDCLLALDEISECDPREVGIIVYALGNGRGKQRASRTGNARGVTRWRCFILSSGERTIATAMAEGGHRTKAGQSVRLLDIPAMRSFGAWDDLHEFASGPEFSDAEKNSLRSTPIIVCRPLYVVLRGREVGLLIPFQTAFRVNGLRPGEIPSSLKGWTWSIRLNDWRRPGRSLQNQNLFSPRRREVHEEGQNLKNETQKSPEQSGLHVLLWILSDY